MGWTDVGKWLSLGDLSGGGTGNEKSTKTDEEIEAEAEASWGDSLGGAWDDATGVFSKGTVEAARINAEAMAREAEAARAMGAKGANLVGLAENRGQGQLATGFQGALNAILGGAKLPSFEAPGEYLSWENQLQDLYEPGQREADARAKEQADARAEAEHDAFVAAANENKNYVDAGERQYNQDQASAPGSSGGTPTARTPISGPPTSGAPQGGLTRAQLASMIAGGRR